MDKDQKLIRSIAGLALATAFLLLVPLAAMQFTSEVLWTLFDFILAGTFLFGTGLAYKLITMKSGNIAYRFAVGFALFTGLLLLWVNGAAGIIGTENNAINTWYFAVIAVGIIGALITRFQAEGMALTMLAMAFVQTSIAVSALITGMAEASGSSFIEIIGVNGFFIVLFAVSALLFRNAGQAQVQK